MLFDHRPLIRCARVDHFTTVWATFLRFTFFAPASQRRVTVRREESESGPSGTRRSSEAVCPDAGERERNRRGSANGESAERSRVCSSPERHRARPGSTCSARFSFLIRTSASRRPRLHASSRFHFLFSLSAGAFALGSVPISRPPCQRSLDIRRETLKALATIFPGETVFPAAETN